MKMKNKIKINAVKNPPDYKWKIRQEKRMIKKIRGIFKKQQKWILKEMRNLSFFSENSFKINKNSVDNEIMAMIGDLPEKPKLAREIVSFMRIALKRGGKRIVKDLKIKARYGIDFDVKNPRATEFLEKKEEWELSDFKGNIDGTTKKRLKTILVEAHESGASYEETAEKITKLSDQGVFSEARGQLIAVREIGVAYEEGNAEVMNEFRSKYPGRKTQKKWQTVNDARVTASHRANQGEGWVDYSVVFSGTGDQHAPGSDNPRCRCFTKYKIPRKK